MRIVTKFYTNQVLPKAVVNQNQNLSYHTISDLKYGINSPLLPPLTYSVFALAFKLVPVFEIEHYYTHTIFVLV